MSEQVNNRFDFSRMMQRGRRVFPTPWLTLNYLPNRVDLNRFGWTVPTYVGNAVTRNKLKRWCRVISRNWRDEETFGKTVDLNFVFRRTKTDFYRNLKYQEFKSCLETAARKLKKHV